MASPNTNWTERTATALEKRRKKFADNVLNHNALLMKLNQRGNIQTVDGGTSLVEELEYDEAPFAWYSGYEVWNVTPAEVFTVAEFDWKQAVVVIAASGLELRINSGRERTINLLEARIKNGEKTMQNNISTGVFSDGTGSSGKQIGGLQLLVADDPTTGTVGGINRANFAFWRNQKVDSNDDLDEALSATTIQGQMNKLWLQCVRGMDKPDLIVADSNYFSLFWSSLQAIQRITNAEKGSSGFRSIEYMGPGGSAPVFHDDSCPTNRMYFLNSDYFHWRPHSDANMVAKPQRESFNQDSIAVPVLFQGNLCLSNASLQGVLLDTYT